MLTLNYVCISIFLSAFDLAVVYDEVDQQASMNYELSKIGTPGQHDSDNHEVSTESSINEG